MTAIKQLFELLERLEIKILSYRHPPLQTCEQAEQLQLNRQGQRTKNLFLRDNYGKRHFLLITTPDKQVDLKTLSKQQGMSRLGFASPERLARYLGVQPGHVSLLALINDPAQQVELWLDKSLWSATEPSDLHAQGLQCHPLTNTQTWVLTQSDLQRLLGHWQRVPMVLSVPAQE